MADRGPMTTTELFLAPGANVAPPNRKDFLREMKQENEFFTVKEAADALGLSVTTTYAKIRAGKLQAFRLNGRFSNYQIPKDAVRAYAEGRDVRDYNAVIADLLDREARIAALEQRYGVVGNA